MTRQAPIGPDDLNCHRCLPKKVPMSKVCSSCSLWIAVRGKDKNTGREIDEWMCADRAQILFLGDIVKNTLSGAAATENFRNEMVVTNTAAVSAAIQTSAAVESLVRNVTGHRQIANVRKPVMLEHDG